ncbi:hypothetical protein [Brevundimonas subvibrioides]|uniref:hypothetical protein n=1 Tax=Brevundimonas subvibrioides TaxID=74313 RepID=UPI001FDF9AB8|nr:hypothetical protein [Brevundimonas subvibrioides]
MPFGMEGRAGALIAGDDPQTALYRELNFFPTPPWAARAGGELVRMLDPSPAEPLTVWEPACGELHMALPLEAYFDHVFASDVHAYGRNVVRDFLDPSAIGGALPSVKGAGVDWVVTNPPFAKAEAFVQRGLQVARRGVAVLCRLAFTESVGRYPLMLRKAVTAPFAERVPMQLGSWDPDLSSATAYAWFVWMHPVALADSPFRHAIEAAWAMDATLERLIPPGTCDRLSRPHDRETFAGEAPSAQLELAGLS